MAKSSEIEISVAEVVDYMRLNGNFAPALSDVVGRKATVDAARKNKIRISTKELQKAADVFRIERGLLKAKDTEKWLRSTGVSVESLEEYLETNLLISKFKNALEKKANKNKFMSSPAVKDILRDLIYQDWLNNALK